MALERGVLPGFNMTLRESILIPSPLEHVWAVIADPTTWPNWNPKIQNVRRSNRGPAVMGEQFHAVFKLGQKVTPSEIEVVSSEPPTRLLLRQHFESGQRARSVDIAFHLEITESGVRLTQTVDLAAAGIPWLLRLIIGWVHRHGRPAGPSSLEELRTLVRSAA